MSDQIAAMLNDLIAGSKSDEAKAARIAEMLAERAEADATIEAANAKHFDIEAREAALIKGEKALARGQEALAEGKAALALERRQVEREKTKVLAFSGKVSEWVARLTETDEEPAA